MGWTQKQAAKGLGVHLKTIGNYERGAHTIPRVVKLATERLATDKAAA
jgi:transcriptional regulator with XRE-family HTH domain|tara:strand:+ start:2361 stop:2504 length:144 start_codon:yes stop_codon:yes gene_type:complete